MVIKDALEVGIRMLKEANIESSLKEARLILASVLYKSKEYVMAYPDENLSTEELDKFLRFNKTKK